MTGTVLITGAAKRIGRALALDFAAQGWAVGVHYASSADQAAALAGEIEQAGGKAAALKADLREPGAPAALITECADRLGAPSCLINNASQFKPDDINTVTPESWARHFDTNLRAPVFLAQIFAQQLEGSAGGNIINMLDQKVLSAHPDATFLSYTTAKRALADLTGTLAASLAPLIRVNAIAPGPTLRNARQSQSDFDAQIAATALKRQTGLEEICAAARFILATPSMTGQIITLDAGEHLAQSAGKADFAE